MLHTPTEALLREQTASLLEGFPITRLGPEQERLIDVYREEYFKVGSCTETADRPRAEKAITALYKSHGMEAPRFEWGDGPKWGVERVVSMGESLRESLWASPRDSLGASLMASLGNLLWASLMASLGNLLWASLGNLLWASLGDSIDGGIEVYWIAHFLYYADVLRVPYSSADLEKLRLHDEIARSTGILWPYKDVCVCTERAKIIEWDGGSPPKLVRAVYRDGLVVKGIR